MTSDQGPLGPERPLAPCSAGMDVLVLVDEQSIDRRFLPLQLRRQRTAEEEDRGVFGGAVRPYPTPKPESRPAGMVIRFVIHLRHQRRCQFVIWCVDTIWNVYGMAPVVRMTAASINGCKYVVFLVIIHSCPYGRLAIRGTHVDVQIPDVEQLHRHVARHNRATDSTVQKETSSRIDPRVGAGPRPRAHDTELYWRPGPAQTNRTTCDVF